MENRWAVHAKHHDPAKLETFAHWLEIQARGLWLYARDCDRWGLGTDADEARTRTMEMRVHALICRARSAGLRFAAGDPPDVS